MKWRLGNAIGVDGKEKMDMNVSRVAIGVLCVFLGFLLPILNHAAWTVGSAIQNAGWMMGDTSNMEHLWPARDMNDFLLHMPWILWLYFLFMVGLGLILIVPGWKRQQGPGEQEGGPQK